MRTVDHAADESAGEDRFEALPTRRAAPMQKGSAFLATEYAPCESTGPPATRGRTSTSGPCSL